MTTRIPGYSDADMAALEVLTAGNIALSKSIQDLTHLIAANHRALAAQWSVPPPEKPKRRGRLRYGNITQHAPGHLTAEVVNDDTGQTRRFRITKADDGSITAEEEPETVTVAGEATPENPARSEMSGAFAALFGSPEPRS